MQQLALLMPMLSAGLFIALVTSLFRTRRFLFLVGFAIPFISLGTRVAGVNVEWYTFAAPLALAALILVPLRRSARLRDRRLNTFIFYMVGISVGWMVAEYVWLRRFELAQVVGLGAAQTLYKMPVQLASLLFQILAFYIIPTRARNPRDAAMAVTGFMAGCLLSGLVGILLLIVFDRGYLTGSLAGIGFGGMTGRLGGLSGEPKHFGAFVVVALAMLGSLELFRRPGSSRRCVRVAFLMLLVMLFLTYSTSAWVAFGLMLSVLVSLSLIVRGQTRKGVILAIIIAGIISVFQVPMIKNAYYERVYLRLIDPVHREIESQKDMIVLDIYRDWPLYSIVGFGAGGADLEATDYLFTKPQYSAHRAYVRTPTAALTGVRLLGDFGIVGFLLLGATVLSWHRRLMRAGRPDLAVFVAAGFVATLFVSRNGLTAFLFLSGGAIAEVKTRQSASARAVVGLKDFAPTRRRVRDSRSPSGSPG